MQYQLWNKNNSLIKYMLIGTRNNFLQSDLLRRQGKKITTKVL